METLYLLSGAKVSRHDNTIQVKTTTGDRRHFPVESLQHIIVVGEVNFNTDLVTFLGKKGVRMSFLDYYGNFSGSIEPANQNSSGSVHLAQAAIIMDLPKRIALGKTILTAGIHNLIANLKYYQYRGKSDLKPFVDRMTKHRDKLLEAKSVEQMMGSEGLTRQAYYSAWSSISDKLCIEERTRRPPKDRINALISFCNGMVYSACKHAISKTHLDTTLSFVHAPTQARASLSLDLAEIFKPVLGDRCIFTLVNKQMLKDSDFEEHESFCRLSDSGRRVVVDIFREKMDKEEVDGIRGFRALLLRESFKLQAHVLGMEDYAPYQQRV